MELFKKLQMASFLQAVPFGQCSGFGWQFNNEANKHVSRKVFTILWDLLGGPSSLTGRSLHKLGFSLCSALLCDSFFRAASFRCSFFTKAENLSSKTRERMHWDGLTEALRSLIIVPLALSFACRG